MVYCNYMENLWYCCVKTCEADQSSWHLGWWVGSVLWGARPPLQCGTVRIIWPVTVSNYTPLVINCWVSVITLFWNSLFHSSSKPTYFTNLSHLRLCLHWTHSKDSYSNCFFWDLSFFVFSLFFLFFSFCFSAEYYVDCLLVGHFILYHI